MNPTPRPSLLRLATVSLAAALAAASAVADSVRLADGSEVQGTIKSIAGGKITLETSFAGTIEIDQSKVVAIATEAPRSVRTTDGTVAVGTVKTEGDRVRVVGPTSTATVAVGDITASWDAGAEDPDVAALRRRWTADASFDLNGKTGNSERFAVGGGVTAALKGPNDTLRLYGRLRVAEDDGNRSEDFVLGGADYNMFVSDRVSWYAGTELGRDSIRDQQVRSVTAAGLGYNFIRKPTQELQVRLGASYRFEAYDTGDPVLDDDLEVSAAGLDAALLHRADITNVGVMRNLLAYTPTFEDFSNFVFTHESTLTMPLGGSKRWAFRTGIRNEYTSEVAPGVEELDTTYFAQLVFSLIP